MRDMLAKQIILKTHIAMTPQQKEHTKIAYVYHQDNQRFSVNTFMFVLFYIYILLSNVKCHISEMC